VSPTLGSRWSFRFEQAGGHTQVVVRCGEPGSRALCGKLVLRNEEANQLMAVFRFLGAVVEVVEEEG
jgi:hypothetical protein